MLIAARNWGLVIAITSLNITAQPFHSPNTSPVHVIMSVEETVYVSLCNSNSTKSQEESDV